MAKTNVPQNDGVCQEVSKKNSGKLFESYRSAFTIQKLLAVEVFDGGNDRATDILTFCGFNKLIGGTNFATLGDVSEFYGVTLKYVKSAMSRYGIGAKDLTEDVYTDSYYDFITRFGDEVKKRHSLKRNVTPGTFALYDSLTKRDLVIKGDYDRKTTYISARLILMLACFLYCGRNVPADSMVKAVYEMLQHTSFFEAAHKRMQENERKRHNLLEAKRQAESGEFCKPHTDLPYDSDNILAVRANGDVIMSGEVFGKLLESKSNGTKEVLDELPNALLKALGSIFKSAQKVMESMDESVQSEEKSDPGIAATQKKPSSKGGRAKTKPENWDGLVPKLLSRELTKTEFAYQTGISPSSVKYFLKKWSGISPDFSAIRKYTGKMPALEKPSNWDQVVDSVNKGLMTPAAAAKATGMSDSSFRRYYKTGFQS